MSSGPKRTEMSSITERPVTSWMRPLYIRGIIARTSQIKAEKRKAKIDILFAKMYDDWSAGRITEYNFHMRSEKYQNEQKELDEKIWQFHGICYEAGAYRCIHSLDRDEKTVDKDLIDEIIMEEVKRIFQLEFRNRLDRIVVFRGMAESMGGRYISWEEYDKMLQEGTGFR